MNIFPAHVLPAAGPPGWVLLLLVALLWGTHAPAMRYIYSLPGPPSTAVVLFLQTLIGMVSLALYNKVRGS